LFIGLLNYSSEETQDKDISGEHGKWGGGGGKTFRVFWEKILEKRKNGKTKGGREKKNKNG